MADKILNDAQKRAFNTLIRNARSAVCTCHVSPDGDALGAALACTSFLRRKGLKADAVVPNIFPDFLKWMPGAADAIIFEKQKDYALGLIRQAGLIVCLDFNEPKRLLAMQQPVCESPAPRIMIDHHLQPADFCTLSVSRPDLSSTCELLYDIIAETSDFDDKTKDIPDISHDEAVCLFTGIMTDTGCFAHNASRPELYAVAAGLLSKGIDKDLIYQNVFFSYTFQRFRLLGYMLYVKLEHFPQYCATLMTLTKAEQKNFAHKKGDTEGFVNIPLQICKTRLSVFLREDTERPCIRVSLRSADAFPCNRMAEEFFHGGGHRNAAGGELYCTMAEAAEAVKKAFKKYAPLLTNKQETI